MKYMILCILIFVIRYAQAQHTTTVVTKIAPVQHLTVTNLPEYIFLKDSLEKLFEERLFIPVLIGPSDSVISSNNLPFTFFIKSVSLPDNLKDLEKGGLTFIGMIYDKLLRSYQQFKKVTITTELITEKQTREMRTVYYLLPGKSPDEEKRIVVYCKQRKKWAVLKIYTKESDK